jgi:predicted nucleotidyltransferase
MTRAAMDLKPRFDSFLAERGLSRDKLVEGIDRSHGEVVAAVATGSGAAGYGNAGSDVDLIVLVQKPVQAVPIMSFQSELMFDVEYYETDHVLRQIDQLFNDRRSPISNVSEWSRRFMFIKVAAKISSGQLLHTDERFEDIFAKLHSPQFRLLLASWWRVEALRNCFMARVLSASAPAMACMLYAESIFAALAAVAAQGGETIISKKWLGAKLERIGAEDERQAYLQTLKLSFSQRGDRVIACSRLAELARRFVLDHPIAHRATARLMLDSNIAVTKLKDGWVVHSNHQGCKLNSVEIKSCNLASGEPVWTGRVEDHVPDLPVKLMLFGMLWTEIRLA